MFKAYRRWNIFERKFFWLNNLGITILMFGSFGIGITAIYIELKLKIFFIMAVSYALGREWLWNRLEAIEAEWKGV